VTDQQPPTALADGTIDARDMHIGAMDPGATGLGAMPSGSAGTHPGGRAPKWLRRAIARLEGPSPLDRNVAMMEPVAERLGSGPQGAALRGEWLGHALHPLVTDMPLGCWIGSGLLDLVGGRSSRRASQRLVGLGLCFVPLTAATGMADWSRVEDQRVKRVGSAHAAGNTLVATMYLLSWRARRRGQHARGVMLGLGGGLLAWVTGYLGGHMSFARATGTGPRGGLDDARG